MNLLFSLPGMFQEMLERRGIDCALWFNRVLREFLASL